MWPSRRILPVALFFGTFAWSFVYVSLPFYIQRLSTVDPVSTLRWTGWILGISALDKMLGAHFPSSIDHELFPVDAYLSKPVAPDRLLAEMNRLTSMQA